jgi:hypothetical protein
MTTGLVTIPPEIAKKRRIRNFTMPDCCRAWLNACGAAREGHIQPAGFAKRFRKLVAHAGISHWPHNALRHSAASYHYQKHGNASLTCSMLGQRSDDVLFTHYRYNERPAWLDLAHKKLDAAVAAAYGWLADLSDEQILEKLLALNLERAAEEAKATKAKKPKAQRAKATDELI